MKTELTISSYYVPDWTTVHGIREIFQNAIDAAKDGFENDYIFDAESGTLKITNLHGSINRNTLLLGETSKQGRPDTIGHYGEGMKLGVLALVRAGKSVTIYNGHLQERWIASIETSSIFNAKVLTFDIEPCNDYDLSKLEFVITGISSQEWNECLEHFLFLNNYKLSEVFETPYGRVLSGKKITGKIFVKGIFVETKDRLTFGYDIDPQFLTVDRDRKMVHSYSLERTTAHMWETIALTNDDNFKRFENLMMNNAYDVQDCQYSYGSSTTLREEVAARFKREHGENAFPVSTNEEFATVEYLGKKPILVSEFYGRALASMMGDVDKLKKDCGPVVKNDQLELTIEEMATLAKALMILQKESVPPFNVEVVEFADDNVCGTCAPVSQRIRLSRKVLTSVPKALETLIHEYAHAFEAGHGKTHQDHLEDIWRQVYERLYNDRQQEQKNDIA